ncbi:MAG: hypothetical protein OD918_10690 [Gammaproteobacteria bacterium]
MNRQYQWFKFFQMIRIKKTMMINVPSWQIKLRIPVRSWTGRQIVKTGHWENENCQFLLKNLVLACAPNSIIVMPEWNREIGKLGELAGMNCHGICTDYPLRLRQA